MYYYGKINATKELDLYEYFLKDEYTEWLDCFFNRVSNNMTEKNTFSVENFQGHDNLNLTIMFSILEYYLYSTKVSDEVYNCYLSNDERRRVIKYNDITLVFYISKCISDYDHSPGRRAYISVHVISKKDVEELGMPIIDVEELKNYARSYEKIHLIEIMRVIKKLKHFDVTEKEILEDLKIAEDYIKSNKRDIITYEVQENDISRSR